MQLSNVEQDTVSILKYALNPQQETPPKITSSWADILRELSVQTVEGLVENSLSLLGVSKEEKIRYAREFGNSIRYFHSILNEQDVLAKTLGEVEYVVLKGTAAAMYYPRPEIRKMGDIDILVRPEEYEHAESLLEQSGYLKQKESARHSSFRKESGIQIELHRKFSSSQNEDLNDILDGMLYGAIPERKLQEVCGHCVPVLPTLENGIVLLGHINGHLSGGLGLRQIVDWMMYVRENLDDAFWNESFRSAAEAIGLRQLAEVSTLLCRRHLGLEGISWCDSADESLADEMLEYVLGKGNFGRKNELSSNKTVFVLHKFANPVSIFKYLTAGGMIHWKAAREHRILKPFAWIYQVGHLVKMGLSRKISLSTFIREMKQSRRETDFLDKVNVTYK